MRSSGEMKIISLNIWDLPVWFVKDRKERIVLIKDFLITLNPDIICLQESFDPDHRAEIISFFQTHGYAASDKHVGSRNVIGRKMDTTGGLVTFSKFPILANSFIPFPRLFFSPIEWLGRKGVLMTLLDTPYGKLRMINVHLSKGFLYPEAVRLRQLKHLFIHVQSLSPVFTCIAGDFDQQDFVHNRKFSELITKHNFIHPPGDTIKPSYRAENKYVDIWMNRIRHSKRLDYIVYNHLGSLHVAVEQYAVIYLDKPLSDHDPVLLDFRQE